jgi:UDP-N-acetylglucosamine--N-acetylmuramyl-(pentapeptide) pyrophosphoryl-undecaprenol N-acetylglucosamine transferase
MSEPVVAVFSGGGTGGHLYPALALASALEERRPDVHFFFVGAERGIEARVLPERNLDHLLVRIEGFRRDRLWTNLKVIGLLLAAVRQVTEAFQRLRPRLVVVTGGYASGPAGLAALLTRTRLVLQEQNSLPGVTTRFLSPFAREVHLAFPESVEALPRSARSKTRVSGNPVRPPVRTDRGRAASAFDLEAEGVVVLIVGGSQGSRAVNEVVLDAVRLVTERSRAKPEGLQLLWATGPSHLSAVERSLAELGSPAWVRTVGYIDDMPLALSTTDLAVSRGGAMATSEFLAWGIPAVLIPLPTAAEDHQTRNAQALMDAGAAINLPERGLSGDALWNTVERLVDDPAARVRMAESARARGRPSAAGEIAEALDRLLPAMPRGAEGSADSTAGRGAP